MVLTIEEYDAFVDLFNEICFVETKDYDARNIEITKIRLKYMDPSIRQDLLIILLEQNILHEFIIERNWWLKENKQSSGMYNIKSELKNLDTIVYRYTITFRWDDASANTRTNITNWRQIFTRSEQYKNRPLENIVERKQ